MKIITQIALIIFARSFLGVVYGMECLNGIRAEETMTKKRMLGYFSQDACDAFGFNVWESEDDPKKIIYTTSIVASGRSPMASKWKDEKFVGYLGEHVKSHKKNLNQLRISDENKIGM